MLFMRRLKSKILQFSYCLGLVSIVRLLQFQNLKYNRKQENASNCEVVKITDNWSCNAPSEDCQPEIEYIYSNQGAHERIQKCHVYFDSFNTTAFHHKVRGPQNKQIEQTLLEIAFFRGKLKFRWLFPSWLIMTWLFWKHCQPPFFDHIIPTVFLSIRKQIPTLSWT